MYENELLTQRACDPKCLVSEILSGYVDKPNESLKKVYNPHTKFTIAQKYPYSSLTKGFTIEKVELIVNFMLKACEIKGENNEYFRTGSGNNRWSKNRSK